MRPASGWYAGIASMAVGLGCVAAPARSAPGGGFDRVAMPVAGCLRYTGGQGVAGDLEIAVRRYRSYSSSCEVTLVPMLHIADAAFYDAARERCDAAGTVLYEWLEGVSEPLRRSQLGLRAAAKATGLALQAEALAPASGWVHVDAAVSEVDGWLARFGLHGYDSGPGLDLATLDLQASVSGLTERERQDLARDRLARYLMSGWEVEHLATLVKALTSFDVADGLTPGDVPRLEAALAHQGVLAAESRNETIDAAIRFHCLVMRRNRLVGDWLRANLPRARGSLAILYGALHQLDLERRLAQLGYRPVAEEWLPAIRVQSR